MGRPIRAHAPPSVPQDFINTGLAISAEQQAVQALPLVSEGMRSAAFGPSGPPPYRPQDGASSRAAWRAEHHGEAFGVAAPEAYVPRMVDRGYMLEEDHDSFLGSGWEEEAPEAELFQEPHGSLDNYRVPLIP